MKMKNFFTLSQLNKDNSKEIESEVNNSKPNQIKTKKEKKKFKKGTILNFVILEDDENYHESDDTSEEKDLTYFEKQNLFFKSTRNMAKKIPYKIAFTQEIESENNKICKSLFSPETKDHDKIVPKNKKGIELISDKEKLHDLFIQED
ncbi:MAG: hypothetical protein K2J02_00350 [Malacoplasma sp.]|nr:hypothetical protein [Malacoplasma sp.]